MDIKSPINSFVQNIEEDAREVLPSLIIKDNGNYRLSRRNCTSTEVTEEESNNEIQKYAATTISELLGCYGYDKMDNGCIRNLNLDHFTPTSNIRDNTKTCFWCGRIINIYATEKSSLSYTAISTLEHYCSETCFIASRKEIFKEATTCDWCRHMGSPISYVDFQDGESQLQFCSDKCLNQYKINIFCHETQTHLMLQGLNNVSFHDTEQSGLITPELWFRNCQSPLNSSTGDTFVSDTHLICNNERPESDTKFSRKTDSTSAKRYKGNNSDNGKKRNACKETSGEHIDEHVKGRILANENELRHLIKSQNYCSTNCVQKGDLTCKRFKKKCNPTDSVNNSYNRQQNDSIVLGKTIRVTDIRKLQEKAHNSPESVSKTSAWFSSPTQQEDPLLPKTDAHKFSERTNESQASLSSKTSTPVQSGQHNSVHLLSTTLLPPATVLVPYPIPVPIPIPIPIPISVPIPTPNFDNSIAEKQKVFVNNENSKPKDVKCQHLLESKCLIRGKSNDNVNETVTLTKNVQRETFEPMRYCPSSLNTDDEKNDQLKHNAKPLRKRKCTNEVINDKHKEFRVKRRNNITAV